MVLDSRLLDNSDGVRLYGVPGLRLIASLSISGPGRRELSIPPPAAFSPDGHDLAVGDRFGNVQLFDARTGRARGAPIVADPAHQRAANIVFSPDGRLLAAASFQDPLNGANVIDLATGRALPLTRRCRLRSAPRSDPTGSNS